jgi:DNA/RNA-binding domain of Phe-tRNA-synthetase-like protein
MDLIIAPEIIAAFPEIRIGVLTARGIRNTGTNADLQALMRADEAALRERLTVETLVQQPAIVAWRDAYKKFGTKPNEFRPTAEALLRRVLRGDPLPTISPAVDAYLAIETEFYLPIGGYNLAQVTDDITLRFSPGGEAFTPIGGAAEETTYAGEVVYVDAARVLTRRWNYRDCDIAKITPESTEIVLVCEATGASIATATLQDCMTKLASYLQRFCGGTITHAILDGQSTTRLTL